MSHIISDDQSNDQFCFSNKKNEVDASMTISPLNLPKFSALQRETENSAQDGID